jgi:hypothetical protein
LSNNDKVEKAKKIINKLEVDIVVYNEHHLNRQDRQNVNDFNQLFKGRGAAIQSVVHKKIRRVQEGRTSLMVIEPLIKYIKNDQPGKDKTGLSRWSMMTFNGNIGRMLHFFAREKVHSKGSKGRYIKV